jgi:hypothetical protein
MSANKLLTRAAALPEGDHLFNQTNSAWSTPYRNLSIRGTLIVATISVMVIWDEAKRKINLEKHGLDFADAYLVYDNPDKITFQSTRKGEDRLQDIAMVAIYG